MPRLMTASVISQGAHIVRSGITAALLVCAAAASARAQNAPDLPVSATYRAAILDSVASKLGEGYFNEERATFIRTQLKSPAIRKSYETLTTGSALVAALNKDLQTWTRDRHVGVRFSASPRPMPKAGPPTPEMIAAQTAQASARNFGFH